MQIPEFEITYVKVDRHDSLGVNMRLGGNGWELATDTVIGYIKNQKFKFYIVKNGVTSYLRVYSQGEQYSLCINQDTAYHVMKEENNVEIKIV